MSSLPFVSIIIPCLNEFKFIRPLLLGLINQTYPLEQMEILVADGMSTDGTREIVQTLMLTYPQIQLLDNTAIFTPNAMNLGLEKSKGRFAFTLGSHALYPSGYIKGLVEFALTKEVALVGGMVKVQPRTEDVMAQSIGIALNHPLGVGNGAYRTGSASASAVDTVAYGCYDKAFLDKVGFFNLALKRNQDIELNKRILQNGGEIWYTPEVFCTYYSKSSLKELWDLYFANGKWVMWTVKITKTFESLSLRHFVPFGFFLYFALLPLLYLVFPYLLICAVIYLWVLVFVSFKIAFKRKKMALVMPLVMAFFTLHFSYGAGSFVGLLTRPK